MSSTLKDVASLYKLFKSDNKELATRVDAVLDELIEKCTSASSRYREDTLTNLSDVADVIELFMAEGYTRIVREIRNIAESTTVYQLRNSVAARTIIIEACKEVKKLVQLTKEEV